MVSNGKISAPVSIEDLMQVLPVTLKRTVNGTEQTVSSDSLGVLCGAEVGDTVPSMDGLGQWRVDSRVNINIWAKYKPVKVSNLLFTNSQWDTVTNKWKSDATWWKGNNGTIGGIIPYTGSLATIIAKYNDPDRGVLNGWQYDSPDGTLLNGPYRIEDFREYNHNAPVPIEEFNVPSQVNREGIFMVGAMMSTHDMDYTYLTLEDFASTNTPLYFGIYLIQQGVSNPLSLTVTAPEPGVSTVVLDFSGSGNEMPAGTYRVYPFLCTEEIPINSQTTSGATFYTCPYLSYATTEFKNAGTFVNIEINATFDYNRTTITANIINKMETSYSNCYLYIIPYTSEYYNNPGAAVQDDAYERAVGPFQLGIGTSPKIIENIAEGSYFVYLTVNSAQYTKKDLVYYNFLPERE